MKREPGTIKFQPEPCIPPVWARGAHTQTIVAHLWPSQRLANKGRRVEVPLPDGDRLVGFVTEGTSKTVVYLFHGLAGDTDSDYIHRTATVAFGRGHTVIMMNHRGCGEGVGLAKGPYHSGRAEDLSAFIEFGRGLFPNHHHMAIGFSLSGNALLLLVSGQRGKVLPDTAISVNAPVHLEGCSIALKDGLNRVYDLDFLRRCKRDVWRARGEVVPVPFWGHLRDFDNAYTAPAGGFKNREEYYHTCSTWNRLKDIQVPTIAITAKDDPFVPVEHYLRASPSPWVHLHLEEFGGHMGYLTRARTVSGFKRWLDGALAEGMKALEALGL